MKIQPLVIFNPLYLLLEYFVKLGLKMSGLLRGLGVERSTEGRMVRRKREGIFAFPFAFQRSRA